MKRRNFIKNSGFAFGSTLLVSNLVSVQGAFANTMEPCPYSLAKVGVQATFERTFVFVNPLTPAQDLQFLTDLEDLMSEARNAGFGAFGVISNQGFGLTDASFIWEYAYRGETQLMPTGQWAWDITAKRTHIGDRSFKVVLWASLKVMEPKKCDVDGMELTPPTYDGPGSPGNPGWAPGHEPNPEPPMDFISLLSTMTGT